MPAVDNLNRTVVKNASANLVRLAGSGIVALLLPPFLVRMLPKDTYGAWALLLQLTLYVSYLDFGIQTAVARFVAHTDELNQTEERNGIVSTAFAMLSAAAVLGCMLIALLAWLIPGMFHQMPAGLYHPAQIALLCMGISFALGLPASVLSATFIGFQRNEIPAVIAIGNKIAMAALVVGVVLQHRGLAAMGAAAAVANLLAYLTSFVAWKSWAAHVRIRLASVAKKYVRQISGYSASVVVWMVAMLMISGLDLSIVGIFDYKATAYYAVAATLTTFVAQAQGAIFSALLPASAVLGARGDGQRLGTMLVASTRYGMLILLAMALPLIVAGRFILHIWAGPDYAQHSTLILQVLVIANVVRLCALPYSTLLLGTGQQKKVIISPLAEGVTNLLASIVGAYLFGAIGVAVGTLIGSFVSVGLHLFYNMPRTSLISIDRPRLVTEGLLRPLICVLPFAAVLLLRFAANLSTETQVPLIVFATLGAALLFWHYGLISPERQKLLRWL
jgi:O-antigen/teichoic acid export membrane protein